MRIGFLNNQIDNRGTGNSLFDYADYNERILGNKSILLTGTYSNADQGMANRLMERFGSVYELWDLIHGDIQIDFLYHIKYGNDDGTRFSGLPYGVHAVFDGSQPHGDRYAGISQWMGKQFNIPYVPHIVDLVPPTHDLRTELHIPDGARVFGRHGGYDTFDISWAWDAINEAMEQDESIYCIFLNTRKPDIPLSYPERFRFMDATSDKGCVSSFIYACDAMVHARARGETFGIACGEFAIAGRPVITYGDSGERAHIDNLLGLGYQYNDRENLKNLLLTVNLPPYTYRNKYIDYNPYYVMNKFKEVFLDESGNSTRSNTIST